MIYAGAKMTLTDKFLNFLEGVGRKRIIMDRESNEPYLVRYYLFLKDRPKWFPFNVFLHKFLKSDPDVPHDHPWSYATLIIKGGYYEWIPKINTLGQKFGEYRVWRGPGHFRVCSPDSFHRIELHPDVTAWTLFMPGIHKRDWGFLTGSNSTTKWVEHEKFLKDRREQANNITA
jgi:hypothetical protein